MELLIADNKMNCPKCEMTYSILNGIPIFLKKNQIKLWNKVQNRNLNRLEQKPLPEHSYYTKFSNGWKRMLDLGCGDGIMSASSAEKLEEIFCIDPDFQALEILKKRSHFNMLPICALGQKLPFSKNFLDGVFFIFVIEHIKDPIPVLSEIHRVLKPQGDLILATDTKWYDRYLRTVVESIINRKLTLHQSNPTHINLMIPAKLRKLIQKNGFLIVKETLHYFIRDSWWRKIPRYIRERFLTSMFVFKCQAIK
jgi:ubiquinone/menaquinone biosynthesis C-methylase UbiE